MRRVGFPKFKPLDVSRRVQQCLRFEGVNANGDLNESSRQVRKVCDCTNDVIDENNKETCCDDHRDKSNLLNTIKKKWRKSKRNKRDMRGRSDSHGNLCQCYSENCEKCACCSKHYRTRKQRLGEKSNIWPMSASILRCQNRQESLDESSELVFCINNENDACSCFGSNSGNCDAVESQSSCSKLTSPNSHSSLSDVSPGDVQKTSTSLAAAKMDSEGSSGAFSDDSRNSPTYATPKVGPDFVQAVVPRVGNLTQELHKLSKNGWYWGPINKSEAESKLIDQPDGSFLVRDSSDDHYILSLSFRSYGKTLHTRIEHSSGLFSFYSQPEPEGQASIVELINQSMCYSQSGVFCYSRSRSPGSPSYPVRLTKPISRFVEVRSLQYLCRFVIRQFTRYDHIQKLPLPSRIKGYLEEGHY